MAGLLPVNVEIKDDLTESTNMVVETAVAPAQSAHKGIIKMFSACTAPWFANRERQVALIAAQTEKDIEDIKAGKKEFRNGELISIEPTNNPELYYKQISDNNGACDAKRLGAAMLDAAIELKSIPEDTISDEPLDQDFFNHWRREAELIDDEEVRQWWAHLLVEETKKPNSISPRTLDVAKNLSKEEAQLFAKTARSIVIQVLLVNHMSEPLGGTYEELLSLQDAGLISFKISNQEYFAADIGNHHCIVLPFFDANVVAVFEQEKISIRCYVLTKAGREINNISQAVLSFDEIKAIVEEVSKQNNNAIGSIYPLCNMSLDPDNKRYLRFDIDWNHPLWTNHLETN